jgi:Flp pilus assembly protein TadG
MTMATQIKVSDRRKRERGVYLGWLAILLPVLLGIMGVTVDLAHYRWAHTQLQNAADAAALAGAKSLNGTPNGRVTAVNTASTFARSHTVDGAALAAAEVIQNQTGNWGLSNQTFTTTGVNDVAANAIRVTVQRNAVQSFFSPILSGSLESRAFSATATAVAGGAGAVACASPIAIASCVLNWDSSGNLICPSNLSFQNALTSIGLTHSDGTSPVNGNNTIPYFQAALANPLACNLPSTAGTTIYLQNGNDLQQSTVNDINTATNNGAKPIAMIVPVVDKTCGSGGPTYNQTATIVGYMKLKLVGARWTGNAPAAVLAKCPTLGKKNICVTNDCSLIAGAAGGGTIQVNPMKVYLVR